MAYNKKEDAKRYYQENKEIIKAKVKDYYLNNFEKIQKRERVRSLKTKEKRKKYLKEYMKEKPYKFRASNAKRKAAKLKQTPKWADLKAIEEFYKNCPEGYEVDHIIPLQGKNVRGLHVLENLQYLTKIENIRKGNRI